MGSVGATTTPQQSATMTRTERMVNRIANEVVEWVNDSWIDEDDKESIKNWHDLLEALDMTATEARTDILDALESDIWSRINSRQSVPEEDMNLSFDGDGEFEDENGNFLKYGQVMKLVKQELVKRGILKVPN